MDYAAQTEMTSTGLKHYALIYSQDRTQIVKVDLNGLREDSETGELYLRVLKGETELRLPIPPG